MGIRHNSRFRVGSVHGKAAMAMVVHCLRRRKGVSPYRRHYQPRRVQPYEGIQL